MKASINHGSKTILIQTRKPDKADHQLDAYELEREIEMLTEPVIPELKGDLLNVLLGVY